MTGPRFRSARALGALAFLTFGCVACSGSGGGGVRVEGVPRIELVPGGDPQAEVVAVLGLPLDLLDALGQASLVMEEWQAIFPVSVGGAASASNEDLPAMLGSYHVGAEGVGFTPRFPLAPRTEYRARFDPSRGSTPVVRRLAELFAAAEVGPLEAQLSLAPGAEAIPTRIVQIYPTTSRLPQNILKMYIHFSAPMRLGGAYEHIRLLDEAGEVVPDAFLIFQEELWDPDRRRFTLLFDPGRIKRNLEPNLTLGLPLQVGHDYVLEIRGAWRDASGRPVAEGFTKPFSVLQPDREMPDAATWSVSSPQPGTLEAVEVGFPEPMDRALLDRLLIVTDRAGRVVPGDTEVTDGERSWRFTPITPWPAGSYQIEVHGDLEDVAGNNLAHLFDVDLSRDVRLPTAEAGATLPFKVDG